MRLLKLLSLITSLFLRGSSYKLVETIISTILAFCGIVSFICFVFVVILNRVNIEIAFLSLAAIFLFPAALFFLKKIAVNKKKKETIPASKTNDPLAQKLPDFVQQDPRLRILIEHITEHPIQSNAAAITLGMVIATEFLED